MRIAGFQADADLVGRRLRLSWELTPSPGESLSGPAPRVLLRRKTRDFELPAAPAEGEDPFLVYDSRAFPPAGTTVAELVPWEERVDGGRVVTTVESATGELSGQPVEVLRRTTRTTFDAAGQPVRRRIEILDAGRLPGRLTPGTTYYYQLTAPERRETIDGAGRATATATEGYGLGRQLYEMLPAIHRRHDVVTHAALPATEGMLEAASRLDGSGRRSGQGQLRRFVDLFGVGLDYLRSRAEGLRGLHDLDTVDHRRLPLLAAWIGWDLSADAPVTAQRHEITYAATLYRLTGTVPGCMVWVRRLTGWDARIKEFARNVFFANNPACRTVDTANPALVAALGTFDDRAHYVYDTGTGEDDRHAYNAVGIFVRPAAQERAREVEAKRVRLRGSLRLFLPVNMRGVIVVEAPVLADTHVSGADLLSDSGDGV
jgi:phage tail-like protein